MVGIKSIDEVLVNVVMVTYNQEKYISQAIESVLMQKCNFGYQLIISDDYSLDNTLNICKEYSEKNSEVITLIASDNNEGIAANYKKAFSTCTAKYCAILEGDDFWIDEYKLQKQIDILENNINIGLVHTGFNILSENGTEYPGHLFINKKKLTGKLIDENNIVVYGIAPLTTCFRTNLVKENVDFDFLIRNSLLTLDILLWSEIARKSEIYFINEITSIYRVLSTSITNTQEIEKIEKFNNTSDAINLYLFNKYSTNNKIIKLLNSKSARFMVKQYLDRNMFDKAKKRSRQLNLNNIENIFLYIVSNHPNFTIFYIKAKRLKHYSNKLREYLTKVFCLN